MASLSPGKNLLTLKNRIQGRYGVNMNGIPKNDIIKATKMVASGQYPLPPLILSRSKTMLIDPSAGLTENDYKIIFSSSSTKSELKRIAKKLGIIMTEELTVQDVKKSIDGQLISMGVMEPFQILRKSKTSHPAAATAEILENIGIVNRGTAGPGPGLEPRPIGNTNTNIGNKKNIGNVGGNIGNRRNTGNAGGNRRNTGNTGGNIGNAGGNIGNRRNIGNVGGNRGPPPPPPSETISGGGGPPSISIPNRPRGSLQIPNVAPSRQQYVELPSLAIPNLHLPNRNINVKNMNITQQPKPGFFSRLFGGSGSGSGSGSANSKNSAKNKTLSPGIPKLKNNTPAMNDIPKPYIKNYMNYHRISALNDAVKNKITERYIRNKELIEKQNRLQPRPTLLGGKRPVRFLKPENYNRLNSNLKAKNIPPESAKDALKRSYDMVDENSIDEIVKVYDKLAKNPSILVLTNQDFSQKSMDTMQFKNKNTIIMTYKRVKDPVKKLIYDERLLKVMKYVFYDNIIKKLKDAGLKEPEQIFNLYVEHLQGKNFALKNTININLVLYPDTNKRNGNGNVEALAKKKANNAAAAKAANEKKAANNAAAAAKAPNNASAAAKAPNNAAAAKAANNAAAAAKAANEKKVANNKKSGQ
ncbi:hypothetical protein [Dishui Lake phycodnavirus 4]|nr:hypothetical protein [Dishui Lake phycodnavirus 4]